MTNQSEQAKGLEEIQIHHIWQKHSVGLDKIADETQYLDLRNAMTFDQFLNAVKEWQQSQPGIKQWVSEGDLYRESEVRLIATRFARESRLKHDVTSNDTITTFDAWFNKENFVQAYLPNSTTTPKSDMVSKEKVIEIIQNLQNKYKQDQTPLSEKVIQECITKIKEI